MNRFHPRFDMPFHYHAEFELIRLLKGRLHMMLNERTYELGPDDYLLISGGTVHGGHPEDQASVYECVVFDPSGLFDLSRPDMAEMLEILEGRDILNEFFNRREFPELCRSCDVLLNLSQAQGKSHNCLLACGQVLNIFGFMLEYGCYSTCRGRVPERYLKHLDRLQRLFRYIYDNYSRSIGLEDMARALSLSPKYFCRFFKELTGQRPIEYLNNFRIECAASLLSSTELSISEIAYSCGFSDPCYFNKLFRRRKQTTPRAWRMASRRQGAVPAVPEPPEGTGAA